MLPSPRPPGPEGAKPRPGGSAVLPRLLLSTALFVACVVLLLRGGRPGGRRDAGAPRDAAAIERALPAAATGSADLLRAAPAAASSSATVVTLPREAPRPAPRRVGQVKFMGLLDNVSDFDDIAQNQAYAALADWVRHLTDDEAAKIRRDDLDFETILKNPAEARGEMVRVMGLLVRFEPVRLVPGAGPADVEDAWRGWLVDPSGSECFVFDTLAAPPAVELRRDLVAVEGAFLKVYRYDASSGETRDAPFLLARRVAPIPESEVQGMKRSLETPRYVILVMGLAAIAMFVYIARSFRGSAGGRALMSHHAELEEAKARLRAKRSKGT